MNWLLIVALVPLLLSTLHSRDNESDLKTRLQHTIQSHPEVAKSLQNESEDNENALFNALPDHRIEGALLARDSWMHWVFAFASAGVFFGLILLTFPKSAATWKRLLLIGAFTATIGILLLIAVQYIAEWTQGRWVHGRGILVLIFYIAKFIGFSYRAALDPETNFFVSFFGFTFGVGMCEEICKAMPLLWHYRTKGDMGWKAACVWGLVSGIGFGVSEGITYSSDMYNGIMSGEIYWVRFASCVVLHAVWAGAAGIFICRKQELLQKAETVWGVLGNGVILIIVPMILHGLYDTLLKKEYGMWALAVAALSFLWFALQIETARKKFGEEDLGSSTAAPVGAMAY